MFQNGKVDFKLQVNSRADLSLKQKETLLNGLYFPSVEGEGLILDFSILSRANKEESFSPAPKSLDYRKMGYVTEVVDQGEKSICRSFQNFK